MPRLFQNIIFVIFQFVSRLIMILFQLIYKPRIIKPKNLRIPSGTFIISNHQSEIDPWLISLSIGFEDFIAMLPIRFPVKAEIMRQPIKKIIVWCFGGYDIGDTPFEKAKKLLFTRNLIAQGYTVMLFPEGKIKKEEIGEFKRGMHMLVQENIPLLMVKISGIKTRFDFTNITLTVSDVIKDSTPDEKTMKIENFFNINAIQTNDSPSV